VTDDDELDGCGRTDGPTTDDDELPYVILFASALEMPEGLERDAEIDRLAAQYR
jgi:hypothetical protein